MKIFIFHATAGHGHKKVAEVLSKALQSRGLANSDVRVFDSLDLTPWVFKKTYPASYFYSVKYTPKVWGFFYENLDLPGPYSMLRPLRHCANRLNGGAILDLVKKENPDVLVCTHFFTAELFASAKQGGEIKARLITIITDFLPHTFWVNEGTDIYWVMSEETRAELLKRGVPDDKIKVGGIPVDSIFQPSGNRKVILEKHGLAPDKFTLLLTSGSFGLGPQEEILKALGAFKDRIQCLVVCGQNSNLKSRLESQSYSFPVKIFGFVDFMPDLMEASDLMIAKPGGSTTTESLAKGLPMIVMEPIPGQESRNAGVLENRYASFSMKNPEDVRVILNAVFENPALLESKKKAMAQLAKPHAAEDLVSFILKSPATS